MTNHGMPLPARPVNRDEALRLVTPEYCQILPGIEKRLLSRLDALDEIRRVIAEAEWFDFGRVDMASTMTSQYRIGVQLQNANIPVSPPYPVCVFRYRAHNFADPLGLEVEEFMVIVSGTVSRAECETLLECEVPYDPPGMVAPMIVITRFIAVGEMCMLLGRSVQFGTASVSGGDGRGAGDSIAAYLALWSVLNCKNLRRRVVEPAAKLNKARLRSGRPPLRRVTYIDTAQFEAAMRATDGGAGHHASPHMHLRRGHLWTLPSGVRRWRRHCIVNANRNDGSPRDHYRVTDR